MLKSFVSLPDESSETDLKKYLEEAEEFTADIEDDQRVADTQSNEFPVEVLFSRNESLASEHNVIQSFTPFQSSKSTENINVQGGEEICDSPFHQTRNEKYRIFMEEVLLIKCLSKKILQYLEDTKMILDQYIDIKNDPGFGHVQVTQAWVWILKEAIQSSFLTVKSDKKRKKSLDSFISQLLLRMERIFKKLLLDTNNVIKTFNKVWEEFEALMEQAFQRFSNNLQSSLEYEMQTSGYNYFFHRKESADSLADSVREVAADACGTCKTVDEFSHANEQSLLVRCSIDGVTMRTAKRGTSWLKFQKIDEEKDIQLLLNIFLTKMTEFCTSVSKSAFHVNELLEVQKSSTQDNNGFKDSVLQCILKCHGILRRHKSEVNFFPKEEVIMLYTMKTTKAAFDLIHPLLIELSLVTDHQFAIVREFTKQRKELKSGKVANRFPLDLNARFELQVEDTNVDISTILNRYPNLRDARELKNILVQKYSDGGSLSEFDGNNEEVSTDILYKCPTQLFDAQSTQEIIEMFRNLIAQQNVTNPNPAYYLFTDIQHEYVELTKDLATSRKITPEMLELCSDPIKKFHQAATELSSFKDKMLTQIVYATQKLKYGQSGVKIEEGKLTQMSSWIQAICKIIHVWDFHSLPKHLQTHMRAKNEVTMRWIAKLEETFGEFGKLVKEYKEDFFLFHDFIEINHGFVTWVRRVFNFNPPNEIVSKWCEESQEDEFTTDETIVSQNSSNMDLRLQLQFQDFDMSLVQYNPEDNSSKTLVTLNKSSGNAQVGLVTVLFTYLDHILSSAIVNLNTALSIHEKYVNLNAMKDAISPDKKLTCIKHIHQLEDLIIALTFEMVQKDIKETIAYVGLLNTAISQINQNFQIVQLHMDDRGMLIEESTSTKSRKSKKNPETDHLNHDQYLNETVQLLNTSVEAMPCIFEIEVEELKNSFATWVKIADKDAKLKSTATVLPCNGYDSNAGDAKVKEEKVEDSFGQFNFEEAMMRTTTGKSFFPNPDQFNGHIEHWRDICFKMLSAALGKFREMTITKIDDTKVVLNSPQLSKAATECENPKKSPFGYTEGLCFLLCLITKQLTPRDRSFVPIVDINLLKDKFERATGVVGNFQKRRNKTEKVLVNNLSLSMTKVESKRLLDYLPVLPLDHDSLKHHDLDEIASRSSLSTGKGSPETTEEEVDSGKFAPNCNLATDKLIATTDDVELLWDSSNKQQVLCKGFGYEDSNWLQFSQLHIYAQLRLIHLLMDEVIKKIEKATLILKDAKEDLICARKLLESTWQGIGKDFGRRIIPGSGVIVLLKLYRHQVTNAVVSLKAIKKTAGEVKYLLSQSTRDISMWVNGKSKNGEDLPRKSTEALGHNHDNYVMSLNGLSLNVILKASVPGQIWLQRDEEKLAEQAEKETRTMKLTVSKRTESKDIFEIKEAVQVKSSTSLLNPKYPEWGSTNDINSGFGKVEENISRISRSELSREKSAHGILDSVSIIQHLILSELAQAIAVLKLPNCTNNSHISSEEDMSEVSNVIGVLTALIAVTLDFRFFKEVMSQDRSFMIQRITSVQGKIIRMQNNVNGVLDEIMIETRKTKKHVQLLDASIRGKFSFHGEYPPIEELLIAPIQPMIRTTPMEFIEGLASSIAGHIWTLTCGIPAMGTIIKNKKTLECHAIPNIPLSSKLEILMSIVDYLGKIMSTVQSNLEGSRKDIASAKSLFKSKGKEITTKSSKKRLLGMPWKTEDIALSKREIKDHLINFAKIFNACTKAQEHIHQISDLLQRANEILQHVVLYINLKFKLEPSVGAPNVDNDVLVRAKNWQTVDTITGIANPPNVPPPVILKEILKKSKKKESVQLKYKAAWENRVSELETYFKQFCKRHIVVDIPIVFAPVSTIGDGCYEDYEI